VSGCFSERFRSEVGREFPEVDLWVGVHDWENLLGTLLHATPSPFERFLCEKGATQHIKIADGCSHGCSFCVIPSIRGPFKSRTPEDILTEAAWLEKQGVRELILVAQDSSFYAAGHWYDPCSPSRKASCSHLDPMDSAYVSLSEIR
jgi:ribosomal protein S12 methylthiotransferase